MADGAMEIIISAVDSASEVFQQVISSVTGMADGIGDAVGQASSDFDTISENVSGFSDAVANIDDSKLEQLADDLGMSTDEVERLIASAADMGSMSAGFNEVAVAADDVETEITEAADAMAEFGSAGDVAGANALVDFANTLKDSMLGAADSAGNFGDSVMRASLEAEGAGISVDAMQESVNRLSEETGRAGSSIRESFIKATARGVTDLSSFETMMKGAGAQATLFGTDIQTMADKFSGLAFNTTLMPKALKETGITMNELATAMGMTGATADEVKAKWKELDSNQRAALLGMAASMNEGENANEEYKNSWAGLQEQMNIAKGRLERIAGSVILPVLIPAMKLAGDVLNGVGTIVDSVMKGPLGGIISVIATLGGAFVIAVAGIAAFRSFLAFLKLDLMLDTAATILNTAAKILNGEASGGAAIANALLGESFMASAAAAWTAAAGFLAAAWPLLVIVGAAALVVFAIYEVGKAFGWWTDVSSMIDAIKDGIMRLWNAFINHPDVQAVLGAISAAWQVVSDAIGWAWNAILEFFGVATGGDFDIVRALIDGIGQAWNIIRTPIVFVIDLIRQVIGVFDQFRAGQMDLPTFIVTVLSLLWNAYVNVVTQIIQLVARFGNQLLQRGIAAGRNFVNGVINRIRQLPSHVYSSLLQVVSRIISAGQQWVSNARSKAGEVVSGVHNKLSEIPGKISSALNGVVDAIVKPFQDAYNSAKKVWDDIVSMATNTPKVTAAGGDTPDTFYESYSDSLTTSEIISTDDNSLDVNINENIILDLVNVPAHIDTKTLIQLLQDKEVLRALTGNRDFQALDKQMKDYINLKVNRSQGV